MVEVILDGGEEVPEPVKQAIGQFFSYFAYDPQPSLFPDPQIEEAREHVRRGLESGKPLHVEYRK